MYTAAKLLFLSVVVIGFTNVSSSIDDIASLCAETPYPQLCNSLLSTPTTLSSSSELSSFRDLAHIATINQVEEAHWQAIGVDLDALSEPAKAAWSDCLALYTNTINKLNSSTLSVSLPDSQTWLSAAIANQQTCQNGFIELNSSEELSSSPFTLYNVSEHLSNLIFINKATHEVAIEGLNEVGNWARDTYHEVLENSSELNANLVVDQDGNGNYTTISDAVAFAASVSYNSTMRFVIYVRKGIYNEIVQIPDTLTNLMMIGDGIDATVVTSSVNVQDGAATYSTSTTTYSTPTFAVAGNGFIAQDMTFENTAGPEKYQAVALLSASDLAIFYKCSFKGYQDTLYVHSQRQYFLNCDVYGTIDFIFGDATVVFHKCNIYARKPMHGQENVITAQGRAQADENTGIIIYDCNIKIDPEFESDQGSFKTYLGRPWQMYSRTVVMKSTIGSLVDPEGWFPWDGDFALSTLYYGEYMNDGDGADTSGRVKWPGYHVIDSEEEVANFTVGHFLAGKS